MSAGSSTTALSLAFWQLCAAGQRAFQHRLPAFASQITLLVNRASATAAQMAEQSAVVLLASQGFVAHFETQMCARVCPTFLFATFLLAFVHFAGFPFTAVALAAPVGTA